MRATVSTKGIAFGLAAIALGTILLATSLVPARVFVPAAVSENRGPSEQSIQLHGKVDILLYDEMGTIKDERHLDNMIVDVGFEGVAYRIAPHDGSITPSAPWNYIAVGTGAVAPATGDTALLLELARLQDTQAEYTTTSGKQVKLQVSFAPGQGTGIIAESGLFNAASAGDMLARQTFSPIVKGVSDTLTVTWTITLSST